MVPAELLILEGDGGEADENDERDHLLDHFQLDQGKGATVAREPNAIGRNLQAILKEGDSPAEKYYGEQPPLCPGRMILETQVPVPSNGHESIAEDQKADAKETAHGAKFPAVDGAS